MSRCSELTPVESSSVSRAPTAGEALGCPCRRLDATDRLIVEVDARDGLANLERVVCLLRGRRHPVVGLTADLQGERAVIAAWGHGLHDGDDDALVLLRLRRLPGILAAGIDPTAKSG